MADDSKSRRRAPTKKNPRHDLAWAVGDFIRYWGFRRIHGAIWTLVYLSPLPLSGAQLTKQLKVSKALVSPALSELVEWGLLVNAPSPDEKTKLYSADPDVYEVIRRVLAQREARLLAQVRKDLTNVHAENSLDVEPDRLRSLDDMLSMAEGTLHLLIAADRFPDIARDLE